MIRGLKFIIPNTYGSFINIIFKNIDVKRYNWKVSKAEIIHENLNDLISEPKINGEDFYAIIQQNYYIVSAYFEAYLKEISPCKIKTYRDFKDSDCEIVLSLRKSAVQSATSKACHFWRQSGRLAKK